jgi:hypothetical protein
MMQRSQGGGTFGGKDIRFGLPVSSGVSSSSAGAATTTTGQPPPSIGSSASINNTPQPKRRTSQLNTSTSGSTMSAMASPAFTSLLPASESILTQDYSLMGLLDVIRMNDPDLTTFALGLDFATLQLDLSSTE